MGSDGRDYARGLEFQHGCLVDFASLFKLEKPLEFLECISGLFSKNTVHVDISYSKVVAQCGLNALNGLLYAFEPRQPIAMLH